MSVEIKEFTYAEVAEHNSKEDLYLVIHDKVYKATSFVDEHPGGEEVLLDVGGQDATEAFEDVGHSDEAREILKGMLVGTLKRTANDPIPKATSPAVSGGLTTKSANTGTGIGLYGVVVVGAAIAYGAFRYLQAQEIAATQ